MNNVNPFKEFIKDFNECKKPDEEVLVPPNSVQERVKEHKDAKKLGLVECGCDEELLEVL